VFDGQTVHTIAPVPTQAVDTVGAGDIFAGAFLYGITHQMPYPQAASLAALAASRLVARRGPRLTVPAMQAILREFEADS
jgi:sugar/nucleoside kinase (ribokinase family)